MSPVGPVMRDGRVEALVGRKRTIWAPMASMELLSWKSMSAACETTNALLPRRNSISNATPSLGIARFTSSASWYRLNEGEQTSAHAPS